MHYCSFSGRTVKDVDEFCANCARRLFLDMNNKPALQSGRKDLCPKCHGSGLIDSTDDKKKVYCDYPGCKDGRIRVND